MIGCQRFFENFSVTTSEYQSGDKYSGSLQKCNRSNSAKDLKGVIERGLSAALRARDFDIRQTAGLAAVGLIEQGA
jgi:hypothetical protein